jgi:hypothetical protein
MNYSLLRHSDTYSAELIFMHLDKLLSPSGNDVALESMLQQQASCPTLATATAYATPVQRCASLRNLKCNACVWSVRRTAQLTLQ